MYCGGRSVVKRGWRGLYQRYKCKDCGRWFNDKTGTVMTHSRLPLRIWFFTAFMHSMPKDQRSLKRNALKLHDCGKILYT